MIARYLIATGTGLMAGVLAALALAFGPAEIGGMRIGPWTGNRLIGSMDAGPVLRAIIARRGLLALRQSETMYFSADHDDEGRPLSEDCTYLVRLDAEPQARWWSLTLYAEDEYLAVNGQAAHSVAYDPEPAPQRTHMDVQVSRAAPDSETPWISTVNSGAFNLTLRLYHPHDDVLDDPARANLPSIRRLECGVLS